MSKLKKDAKILSSLSVTLLLVLLYIIIFEFTWVSQNYIPKPSLLLESFFSLWSAYKLNASLIETTSVIFPVLFFSVIIFEAIQPIVIKILFKYEGIFNIAAPFKYFSFFFAALIFNLVFPQSFWGKILFAFLFTMLIQLKILFDNKVTIKDEYILAIKSLGVSENKIYSKVIWKTLQPHYYGKLHYVHLQLWIAVLIYEFISASIGVGAVYRTAFEFNDLSAVIALGIFISLIIWAVNSILKFAISKFIFWE
jgi:ABC-type nitrate/sulfonate/bicarbonate transport system permease component